MPPRKAVAPSPARSTRSARSRRDEDPSDSSTRKGASFLGLHDTSINIATAFHAAQTGQLPTPGSDQSYARSPAREMSPSEQLAASARALSPVRFFLRPTDDDDYNSFSSLGTGAEPSYDYGVEEEFVRQAQAEVKKGRKKGKSEDAPYRPAEDDWQPETDESEGEGEGVVRGGGLEGRAATRGTRSQKGEGYLGMGLGLRSRNQKGGREGTPDSFRRSPTPVQVLARTLSPMVDRRPKRQPGAGRTATTNILHGVALALRFAVEVVQTILYALIVRPFKAATSSSRSMVRTASRDWWKWLLWLLALSVSIRVLEKVFRASTPGVPTGLEDIAGRLAELESAMAAMSSSTPRIDHAVMDRLRDLEKLDTSRLTSDFDLLRSRIANVEDGLRGAFDEDKIGAALQHILPEYMPVRQTPHGSIEIDPGFWTEMRKKLVGQKELDTAVKDAIDGKVQDGLEKWAKRWMEDSRVDGTIISRADFVKRLEAEVSGLKGMISKAAKAPLKVKGDDVTSLLQDLIDASLLRYSKDTIARPDYALFTAGARVVPSITSDTLVMRQPGAIARWVLGKKPVEGRSPATALHPDNTVGSCWPFAGDQGQIGIVLNRRVKVSDVTVEHAAKEIALDTSTAPKDIEVWGLMEGENLAKVGADRLLLGKLTYDPRSSSHIQTFAMDAGAVDMDVDVGVVIFKVLSNWGGDFTCLYRLRVHGTSV